MIVPVKFFVDVRVFDSKIRAKIDNTRAGGQKRFGELGRETVRQREENKTGGGRDLICIGIGKLQRSRRFIMSKPRENLGESFAGETSRRRGDKIDIRMREQQPNKLFAGVTRSADDCHFGFRHKPMRISSRADCNENCVTNSCCVARGQAANVPAWSLPLF